LDDLEEQYGLVGEAGDNASTARKLAVSLRESVKKDVEAAEGQAMALADGRKAALEKEAADAAAAVFEATKAKASKAGADMKGAQQQLKFYQ